MFNNDKNLIFKAQAILANQTERLECELALAKKESENIERNSKLGILLSPQEDRDICDRIKRASIKDMMCFEKDLQSVYDLMSMTINPNTKAAINNIYKIIQSRVTEMLLGRQ